MCDPSHNRLLVTGGAGFIGSALVRHLLERTGSDVLVVDKLGYAGNLASLAELLDDPRLQFVRADICEEALIAEHMERFEPDAVVHLAAESHVDRSIDGPSDFIRTNILGTYTLLERARAYWNGLPPSAQRTFRFLHVSTDEVYGSLGPQGSFTERTPYDPRSPYSASKASSDHLVRSWFHTFGLPTLVTNCSNNYGPRQFPEKLIPVIILNALRGEPVPIYGKGENVRDWLFVEDHVRALLAVLERGRVGETYNVGGKSERRNIDVAETVCRLMNELVSVPAVADHVELISFVEDRPGHDLRYSMDIEKIREELGWGPRESFDSGMRKTVEWYLSNLEWCREVMLGSYGLERLGLNADGTR